ncbi:s4 domain-containing protein YaaA [Coprobacillus sp. CAG:826]|jgi:ribosome-associated protein|nr:S4 domain-containing protein YaaA [Coprobacillus sp.]CDD92409.1 s4 domain-containing protein YaaA [Coprobacillus sp. CAG:826]
MKEIQIHTPFITLGQFLKLANLISNGGEAKLFLMENIVYVNQEKENRRGRKLYPGYEIELEGQKFMIVEK